MNVAEAGRQMRPRIHRVYVQSTHAVYPTEADFGGHSRLELRATVAAVFAIHTSVIYTIGERFSNIIVMIVRMKWRDATLMDDCLVRLVGATPTTKRRFLSGTTMNSINAHFHA